MPYVSVRLTDGLGNRFFQVAALLGYAERYGHTPVFVKSWTLTNSHAKPGSPTIYDYFPAIAVLESVAKEEWTIHKEAADSAFTYAELPKYEGNVCLEGYFQSPLYSPSYRINPNQIGVCPVLPTFSSYFFLHVRRGDYLSPYTAHHRVPLSDYYRRAVSLLDPSSGIIVCSDDMSWCRNELPRMFQGIVRPDRWIMTSSDLSEADTLALFSVCDGGICANSTFSWWGAYLGKRREVYMPDTWGFPPMPIAKDLYPTWAYRLPV
jgi:hypothetical protein